MTRRCCVCRVEKTREATSEGIRFFLIPSTKSASYGEWIRAIKIEGKNPNFNPKRTSIICSKHFTDDSFFVRRDARVSLKDDAKPTIFDPPIPVERETIPTNVAQPETNGSDIKDDDVFDSPPDLLAAISKYNSDYEENAEEPPDLDIYSDAQDNETSTLLADPITIAVDHIESVADILGPDACVSADTVEKKKMNQETPESGGTVELDIIDGQSIVSFLSLEEMEEYSARHRSSSLSGSIAKTNKSSGRRRSQGKCQPGQPTPSPYHMLEGAIAPVFSRPTTTPSPSVDMDIDEKGVSIIIAEPSPSATDEEELRSSAPALEMMDSDGYLTPQFAKFAVSAVNFSQRGRYRVRSAKKAEEEAPPPLPRKKKPLSFASQSKTVQPPSQEADDEEVSDPNLVMTGVDLCEAVPVLEEEYLEVYDVPGKANVSAASCGKLFCQMGCVCLSLEEATSRKASIEHCSRPDCMLQCVCGFLPGIPSSQRTFSSLLKGNESFYSKINWSTKRSKRERKAPERYSEFHLNKDLMFSPEENLARSAKQNYAINRLVSPFKLSNKVANQLQKQQVIKTKPEPLRIKNGADEIKLLLWDSFVSIKKIYVAPDQDVYCIEHSNCTCPCIAENSRIIRILNKFSPPNEQVNQSNEKKKSVACPPSRNVARKHTHPIMRTAHLKGASSINGSASPEIDASSSAPSTSSASSKLSGQVVLNTPGGNVESKMRKLLQDDRFQLQKLMNEEKMRAFDDEIDLTIRSGQTAQLVAWMRFHSVYHSGKMHIRYLSRRSGSVILVMKPTDIVAPDITCDIKDMKDKPNTPEIVNELLDSCISSEETSRYAFLLCDGVKWELAGCFSLKASTVLPTPAPPQSKPAEVTQKSLPAPRSSGSKKKLKNAVTKAMPEVILEEHQLTEKYRAKPSIPKAIVEKSPASAVSSASNYEDNSTEERYKAMQLKRKKLEERLNQLNSKLHSAPVKVSFPARSMKPKMKKYSSTAKDPLLSSSPAVKEPLPTSDTSTPSQSTGCWFDQCILPDEISKHSEPSQSNGSDTFLPDPHLDRSDSMNGDESNGSSSNRYPTAEKPIMFSRQVMSNRVGINTSSLNPMSAHKPRPLAPPIVFFSSPTSLPIRPDGQLMKLPSIGVNSVPLPITPITGPNRPLLISPLQRMSNTASTLGLKSSPTVISDQHSSLADHIRLQRLDWISKGIIPPVVAKNTVGPSSITPSMPVIAVTASTSTGPALEIIPITETSAASVLKTAPVTLISGSSSTAVHIPSDSTVTPEKPQTTINTSTSSEQAEVITVSPVPPRNKAQETSDATKKNEEDNSFFPKVLSTHVDPVRLAKPNEEGRILSSRLKISFAALTGEHRDLSPTPSIMLLPLNNANDEWCMVACPAVPEGGLQIPGVNILIPRDVFVQAATTAVERKARVSYPLYFHGKVSSPILKKGFCIYGTPQLPHHVFLGPFLTEHLDSFATFPTNMFRISSKTEAAALPEPLTPAIVSAAERAEVLTVSSAPPRNKAQETGDATKKNEEDNSFFPKVLSTHVGPVRLVKPTEEGSTLSSRLKISFAALTGEHRDLSPAPSTMLLPLNNANDEWCMVACPAVPEFGLQIPGGNILIPRDVVMQAATTAVERKARVSFPLHLHGEVSSPVFKIFTKGFGVYGTPQLSHHVFLGPFHTEHLDSFATIPTCMVRIPSKTKAALPQPLTSAIVSVTTPKDLSDSLSTQEKPFEERPVDESSETVPAATDNEDVVEPKPVNDSPVPEAPESSPLENETPLDDPAELNEPVPEIPEKGILECADGMPESAGEDDVSNPSSESQQDTEGDDKSPYGSALKSASAGEESDVEIVDECKRNPPLLKPPVTPVSRASLPKGFSLPNLPKDFGTHKSTKPQRIFVARTRGLPTTTMAIFEDNLVLVKHPFKPEKSVSFSGVNAAKHWLQSLSVLTKEQGACSTERKRSAPADESSSTSAWHAPKRERRSHEYDGDSIHFQKSPERSDVSDPSSSAPIPKRVPRLSEKARILAAQTSRHNEVSLEPERSTSARGPHSKSVQGRPPKGRSELVQTPDQYSSFKYKTNRKNHIIQEQERRVLLAKLFRDLDSLIAPNSGVHAKIVVLKNATSTIKSLDQQNKALSSQCEMLKTHRVALLKLRQKMFNELPNEVRQVFTCLMDTTPVPARHAAFAEARSEHSHQNESIDSESSSNSAFHDPDDIDVASLDADAYDSESSMPKFPRLSS